MTLFRLIRNNLRFYLRKHLLLAAGIAVSGAVITGALLVGDSVDYSLRRIVEYRLGQVTHVVQAGDRYFTTGLADRLEEGLEVPVVPLLLQEGVAVAGGGQIRVPGIQVLGVGSGFDRIAGQQKFYEALSGDSIIISENLSHRLNLGPGDLVLLRIQKASLIPMNAPFVSDAESVVAFRAVIKSVAGEEQLGRFNLQVSQTAPFNVFISLSRLEELMAFSGRANVMLLDTGAEAGKGERAGTGAEAGTGDIRQALRGHFTMADAGLEQTWLEDFGAVQVTSQRIFLGEEVAGPLQEADEAVRPILTYFVNRIEPVGEAPQRFTPYSFVSTLDRLAKNETVINEWLAEDLQAGVGDTLRFSYFVVGPLRELGVDSASFVIKEVVPLGGRYGDRHRMPDLPGLSDAGNCRDWETGVPIELEWIRDKDEVYWDQYGGTPKAYISTEKAVELWENRFGRYTSFRYLPGAGQEPAASMEAYEERFLESFDPFSLGYTLENVVEKGYRAAGQGVDFTQLFAGLSFFLLVAGILLSVLLFLLNLESRKPQLRTLVVMGIPLKTVRKALLIEQMIVAVAGALAGLLLSVGYNKLVFLAMNGVWRDVVRTEMMYTRIRFATLVLGFILTGIIALAALYFPLNRMLKKQVSVHRRTAQEKYSAWSARIRKGTGVAGAVTGVIAILLIAIQFLRGESVNQQLFFVSGGLLLFSAVLIFLWYLGRLQVRSPERFDLGVLSWKNALRNRTRSISVVILFAIGAFLVISTGSNRKDLFSNAGDPSSGTGGFLYYAESTAPVLRNLNNPEVRQELSLEGSYEIVQFRRATGDDASCLNLNRVVNPRIIATRPGNLSGRFTFVTRTDHLDEEEPWRSLRRELPDGVIPAIADETVIKWGLGMEVGDTLQYTDADGELMELLLIGGIAPSIFQGSVIISEQNFLRHFPESSGTHIFLMEGEPADTALIAEEMQRGLRDLGWDMEQASVRLARFNSVTNTYLSIFMVMGALGLLVGTFGLAVVLSRSIMERKQEIALLKAVGFRRNRIRRLVIREYLILLLVGIGTGFITAVIATFPSLMSAHTGSSFRSILFWLVILVINGWFWIWLIARSSLNNPAIYRALRNE